MTRRCVSAACNALSWNARWIALTVAIAIGLVGGYWSNKERLAINQDPSNIPRFLLDSRFPRLENPGPVLRRIPERFFPQLLVPVQPARTYDDTWTVYYNFDQYLWNPGSDRQRGIGIFFRFGPSHGLVNPVKYAYNVGLSGNGVVPGRPDDAFGVGWSRIDFSRAVLQRCRHQVARADGRSADRESGAQEDADVGRSAEGCGHAVVGGLRAFVRF